ncbi:beta-galactosidase [Cohnella cellulosilytica]|uniref:Beta-galactosidase n=1 Tax=Cohnella cellulosilytica TaxID=986710 RepID=A0ABW2FK79_9BACL
MNRHINDNNGEHVGYGAGLKFGVDYYPEHCPREAWEWDADGMRDMGIDLARLAEFAWAKLEPEEGRFDFAWLDESIRILHERGIKIVLGTPTAAPPVWLMERSPDVYPVTADGRTMSFGGRHHDCQSNATYRADVRRIVRAMAEHYKDNPAVVGWQTDNELGNSHQPLCYCDSCQSRFQQWLAERYGTIEALNAAWGTIFWSQTYARFEQIPAPKPTPNSHNPSHLLAWKRFCSDLVVDFQKEQVRILREVCPRHFVTHNFMGFFDKTDYFELAKDLDFASHDQYPMLFLEERIQRSSPSHLGMALDLMRGTKERPFWIMEQLAGPTGTEILGSTPRPGQMRLWTYQSVAHGADAIVYFRWDTALVGSEQYWHGILPHSRVPGRRHAELKRTIAELSPHMDAFRGAMPEAEVGILFSYDQEWAMQIQPHHPSLHYVKHLHRYYHAFFERNVPVDLVSEHADLSRYKALVAPLMFLTRPELVGKLRDYAASGGRLLLDMRAGVKDWDNAVVPLTLPGEYAEMAGIRIEDYDCLRQFGQAVRWLGDAADKTDEADEAANLWCDIVTLDGAEALAEYTLDYYANTPAVTRNAFRDGLVYYVGTQLGPAMMANLAAELIRDSGIAPIAEAAEGVEWVRRRGRDGDHLFALNHRAEPAQLHIPEHYKMLAGDGAPRDGRLALPAYGTALLYAPASQS